MSENKGPTRTLSRYLLQLLHEACSGPFFGVRGDDVLEFPEKVIAPPIEWGGCNRLHAGCACGGYPRLKGARAALGTQI